VAFNTLGGVQSFPVGNAAGVYLAQNFNRHGLIIAVDNSGGALRVGFGAAPVNFLTIPANTSLQISNPPADAITLFSSAGTVNASIVEW
jgi:hypothetical protein